MVGADLVYHLVDNRSIPSAFPWLHPSDFAWLHPYAAGGIVGSQIMSLAKLRVATAVAGVSLSLRS